MLRLCLLALTLLGVAACNGDKDSRKNPKAGGNGAKATRPPPESPTTGISQIQKLHDELKEDIAEQEKRVAGGQPAEQRLVRGQLTGIDILIKSTEMAITLDTRQTTQREHGILRQRASKVIRARGETYNEIAEMNTILENHEKGGGSLPAGFTLEELKDRRADFVKAAQKLDNDWKELRAAMESKEKLLKLDVIPPQGETLFTKELEELQLTRKRVEALLE
jgi:hypothetical protein